MLDPVRSVYRTGCGAGRLGIGLGPQGEAIDRGDERSVDRGELGRHDFEVKLGELQAQSSRPGVEGSLPVDREPVSEGPDAPRLRPAEGIDLPRRHTPNPAFFDERLVGEGRQACFDERDSRVKGCGLRVKGRFQFLVSSFQKRKEAAWELPFACLSNCVRTSSGPESVLRNVCAMLGTQSVRAGRVPGITDPVIGGFLDA